MTTPPPFRPERSSIGLTARSAATAPRTLVASIVSISSSSRASKSACGTKRVVPAQLTKTSQRPQRASMAAASDLRAALSVTDAASAAWPVPGKVFARSSAAAAERLYPTMIRNPVAARARQIAAPIPPAPPVISATGVAAAADGTMLKPPSSCRSDALADRPVPCARRIPRGRITASSRRRSERWPHRSSRAGRCRS